MRGLAAREIIAAALCFTALRAQTAAPRSYRQVVDSFLTTPNAAARAMLAMDPTELARAVHDAARADSGWSSETLEAAMLMHTDAAISIARDDPDKAWANIRVAQDLGDAVVRDPELTWFVHQWSGVVATAFRGDQRVSPFVSRWHAQGWHHVMAAMDRGRLFERDAALMQYVSVDTETFDHPLFRNAIHEFQEVVASHVLVGALHLGRIQMLRGHDAEARQLFESAAGSHVRGVRYLANLFLGSMEERGGRPDAAEQRYRAGLLEHPRAQSGRIALASLLARSGREEEGRAVLRRTDAGPPSFDPWWSYIAPDARNFAVMLAELHAEIRP
jgi:hypothetical protein